MSGIDDLLTARAHSSAAPSTAPNIDSLLAARSQESSATSSATSSPPVSRTARFAHGFTDLATGLGQITEHVAETPLNYLRAAIRGGLNAAGAHDAASLFGDVSTADFDRIVQQREQDYQQARADAGQTGIDWWRLGGEAANPLNYALPEEAVATSVTGRIGVSALQGAAIGAAQPSTTPGSFWWDKAKGAGVGAVAGGVISGAIEGAMPLLKMGFNAAKRYVGASKTAAASPAADAVVHGALNAKGVDPASVDVNLLAGMKQEVQSALEHKAEISEEGIANRARAESLPVPVKLMRGQATGDAAAFTTEQNLRGITGVGEPLTQRLTEQNSAFIQNLDTLGAKNAPDPVSTSTQMSERIQSHWDVLDEHKNDLYASVRNSKGQPAMMDQFTAAQSIRDALDTPQASHAYDSLPGHIQRTIEDLEDGKLPLTVAQMQSLDKAWGADARAADGSTAFAINTARRLLGAAPIHDDVGQQAMQAYKAASAAHAQQMSMVTPKLLNGRPNPDFQPLMKAVVVDGKPPESLFQTHFMGAAPSVASKNLAFLQQLDPDAAQTIGRTFMGEVKRLALSSASDERGTVSQSVLNGYAKDPVKSARLDALVPAPAAQTFRNLAATVEVAKRFPVASSVNTSNTGSAVVNAGVSMLKQNALAQLGRRVPIVKPILEANAEAAKNTKVNAALNPGVTVKSLMSSTPSQAARRRIAAQLAIPGAVTAERSNDQ